MATIVTRSGKGSALTHEEMDNNFTNLNSDKLENVSEDTTPQLGGTLDTNGNVINDASGVNIQYGGSTKLATTSSGIDVTGSVVCDDIVPSTQLSHRNLIINGDFRINQRGASSKTQTSSAYNYDRWYYNGTTLEQRIESGNYKPSTTHTLSGTNVTTQQITSPSSGTWTITVPTNADDVQLEEGSVATPFELRNKGEEMALCQRYYYKQQSSFSADSTISFLFNFQFPVTMRTSPSVSYSWGGVDGDFYKNSDATTPSFASPNGLFKNANGITTGYKFGTSFTKGDTYTTEWELDAEL